jgi:hypothetical protein
MAINESTSIQSVLSLLRTLDDSSVRPDGTTTQFLEIRRAGDGDDVSINGNFGGLVHFARLVLEVAEKSFAGAHQHFDEAGGADFCEVPLIITFKPAEWDI